MRIEPNQAFKFLLVGGIGFLVDAGGHAFLYHMLAFDILASRIFSMLLAILCTFTLHRLWTFRARHTKSVQRQAIEWLATQGVGQLVNFLVFSALVTLWPIAALMPIIAIFFGSLVAMLSTWFMARYWVFR